MELTDEQWAVIEPLIPEQERNPSGPGRPWRDARAVMNGILWILRTGARWQDVPDRYPSYQTCHRRFQQWVDSGVFEHMLQAIMRWDSARPAVRRLSCRARFVPARAHTHVVTDRTGQLQPLGSALSHFIPLRDKYPRPVRIVAICTHSW